MFAYRDALAASQTTSPAGCGDMETFSMGVAMVTVSARVGEHYAIRRTGSEGGTTCGASRALGTAGQVV